MIYSDYPYNPLSMQSQNPKAYDPWQFFNSWDITFYYNNPSIIMDHNEWYHILIGQDDLLNIKM